MMDESRLTAYYSKLANKLDEMIPCEALICERYWMHI